jgi:hypothetical protein
MAGQATPGPIIGLGNGMGTGFVIWEKWRANRCFECQCRLFLNKFQTVPYRSPPLHFQQCVSFDANAMSAFAVTSVFISIAASGNYGFTDHSQNRYATPFDRNWR